MQEAYILINTEPERLWEVAAAAVKIEGVKMAHAVTGQFDVIVFAEVPDTSTLGELIHDLRAIEGVQKTHTSIAIPIPSYLL
jgi:DNA-binding Lrp family transcriptional regulator